MPKLPLAKYLPNVSSLGYGCMGLGGDKGSPNVTKADINRASQAIDAALDIGINLFDHADIYAQGKAERVFGAVLKNRPLLREDVYIQSKCGIRFADAHGPGRYDFSKEWICESVNGILTRLGIEYLDVLLLHRPDPLARAEEVAEAITRLKEAGKVRYLGVSNMHAPQLAFLQHHLDMPIIINQIELSLSALNWLEEGVLVGNTPSPPVNFASGTFEYCALNAVQVQSWGAMSQGLFTGRDVSNSASHIQQTAKLVDEIATSLGVSPESIVLSWLMKHPSSMQAILGSTDPDRIKKCAAYNTIDLSREQWYALYVSARGQALP